MWEHMDEEEEHMDELVNRLKAATVLSQTHGALAPTSWAQARRRDLINGVWAIVEDSQGRLLAFVPQGGGFPIALPVSSIAAITKRASGFNTVVDIELEVDAQVDIDVEFGIDFESDSGRHTICLVGPRGRVKKIVAAAGHTL